MILSPPENESLKYSPKLDKAFVNADQSPLSKNFQISPLRRTSVKKKTVYLGLSIMKNQLVWAGQ